MISENHNGSKNNDLSLDELFIKNFKKNKGFYFLFDDYNILFRYFSQQEKFNNEINNIII